MRSEQTIINRYNTVIAATIINVNTNTTLRFASLLRFVGVLVWGAHKSASREVDALCDKLEGKSWGKFGELVMDMKDKILMA